MKNDLSYHNLNVKDTTKLALDRWSHSLNWCKPNNDDDDDESED